jgi:zeta-carotene desaturase
VNVVVIGGGFAGLSAATALCERGVRVELLEARPSLGGRASAYTDPATGERVDNGQHVLIGCYHDTFEFLARIGSRQGVDLQENLTIQVIDRQGRRSCLACPPWPAPLHLLGGLLRWDALGWRDRFGALRLRRALQTPRGESRPGRAPARGAVPEARTGLTVRQWLVSQRQTARLIELLWEPLAVAALNESVDVASAAPFREVLRRMFTSDRRDSSLGLPVVPLDALYAEPARAFVVRHGGTVRTGARARVTVEAGGPRRPVVSVHGEHLRPDAVVCAVAWHALPDVFPSPPLELRSVLEAARGTAPSPIVTVNLWLDRRVTSGTFVGLPGRSMQWVFDKRSLFGDGSSHLSLVSSGAGAIAGRTSEELVELATTELREAMPEARGASVRRATVVRERRATFSVAPDAPTRPGTHTAVEGLFLAGDWIDTGLPATIESAVISGHRAADAVRQAR